MPSPFETYEFLLRKLARLMALDPGEKCEEIQKECDDIRDHMDGPWLQLTEEERERAHKLSADLYQFKGGKMYEDLRDVIASIVQDHLAEWGTTAKVVGNGEDQSLRNLLNGLCSPLIEELHAEVSKFYKENKNECS